MKIAVIGAEPEKQLNLWIEYMMKVDELLGRRRFKIHEQRRIRGKLSQHWTDGLWPEDCYIEVFIDEESGLFLEEDNVYDTIEGILEDGIFVLEATNDTIDNKPYIDCTIDDTELDDIKYIKFFDVNFASGE